MPYTLLATAVPAPVVPAALLNPAAYVPTTAKALATGDTTQLQTKANENAVRLDVTGRYGGGGYAVVTGLVLSAGAGLSLSVAAGQAMIDGPVTLPSGGAIALTDNIARVHVWLSQAGTLTAVNNSLTPPAGAQCYLGSAVTAAGVITSVDQSGVMALVGGTLWRRTADTGIPGDTPPAALQFAHRTTSELYWWDGTQYWAIGQPIQTNTSAVAAGQSVTIPSGQNAVLTDLDVQGTLTVNGILRVIGVIP